MTIDVLYFAWVRERIGVPGETIDIEGDGGTVSDLIASLREREARYALAFFDLSALRVALDQELADFDAPLKRRARGRVLSANDRWIGPASKGLVLCDLLRGLRRSRRPHI